jgi:hypothetical protein
MLKTSSNQFIPLSIKELNRMSDGMVLLPAGQSDDSTFSNNLPFLRVNPSCKFLFWHQYKGFFAVIVPRLGQEHPNLLAW